MVLPTRSMIASARRSAESKCAGPFSESFMPDDSCELVPTRVGEEALTVPLRQPHQRGADVLHPMRPGIVQVAAAERRQTCRENHRAVDRVLVPHHALAQAGDPD